MSEIKHCRDCDQKKPTTEFFKKSGQRCKTCSINRLQKWNSENPDKGRARSRAWYQRNRKEVSARKCAYYRLHKDRRSDIQYKRNYGITLIQYQMMVASQMGRCAICQTIPERKLCVDHDHRTGQVRGLLCHPCNQGIARLDENPKIFMAAIEYLNMKQRALDSLLAIR